MSGPDELATCSYCGGSYWITEGEGQYCSKGCFEAAYEKLSWGDLKWMGKKDTKPKKKK